MQILVLNCGSSSVKYRLFDMESEAVTAGGSVERIGEAEPTYAHSWGDENISGTVDAADHDQSMMHIRDLLLDPERGGLESQDDLAAVGHRVVHGGERFFTAVPITDGVVQIIEEYASLAPLHNPPNLAGIRAARAFFPDVTHVAVFDTAFHQTMPEQAYHFAIPYRLYEEEQVRRYGFHGTSHRFVTLRAGEILDKADVGFTGITCHLGNGCSITAVRDGKSVDTSMGLTPLEGVPMGTRSGDIDPGVVFHLARHSGMSIDEIDRVLNRESGLLGVSGVSNDLREVQSAAKSGNERAELALQVYAHGVRKYVGAYLAVLGGADAVVFTGGVGENGDAMRARILTGLDGLGLVLDAERNHECVGHEGEISAEGSPVKLLVIPTNEELLIARDTRDVVSSNAS